MKLVYVAGPFRAATPWEVERNIRVAEEASLEVARLGGMPVCPHTMTRYFDGAKGVTGQFWLDGTLELMRRCDAVLVVGAYWDSGGTKGEIAEASRLGLPVFNFAHELEEWIGGESPR